MSLKKGLIALGVAAGLAVGAFAVDQNRATRMEYRRDFLVGYLNLSDAQKTQSWEIFSAARKAAFPIFHELKQNHEAVAAAVKAGAPEKELQKLADQQGALVSQVSGI